MWIQSSHMTKATGSCSNEIPRDRIKGCIIAVTLQVHFYSHLKIRLPEKWPIYTFIYSLIYQNQNILNPF